MRKNTLLVVNFYISLHGSRENKMSSININGSWADKGRREYNEILVQKMLAIILF